SLGLDDGDVFLVQAIFSGAVALLEIPTGYVSDLLGRKRTLLVAGLLHGVAYSMLPVVHGFWGVASFELVAALAVSLYSGTDVALQYDSLEALGEPAGRRKGLGRRLFWMQSGETAAALTGGWLVLHSLQTVAFWNAMVGWVPFVLALGLADVSIDRMGRHEHGANLRRIAHELFRVSAVVRGVLGNLVIYGLATLLAVWSFQGYWEALGIPIWTFGYLWAGYNLTVALVGSVAHRIEDRISTLWAHRLIAWLPVLGYAGMAAIFGSAAPKAWVWGAAILAGIAFQVGRGLTQVILKDELNVRVPANMRATANSVSTLGVRFGFVLLGPLLGWLIDGRGHPTAFFAAAALYVVLALACAWPLMNLMRREREAMSAPGSIERA
ncbi:MAG TPA: MFS transporter, partial [Planctomycetota bacterium]|nr:MFS transporter [Planctomycetota bacterium]